MGRCRITRRIELPGEHGRSFAPPQTPIDARKSSTQRRLHQIARHHADIPMTPKATASYRKAHGIRTGAKVVAWGLVLIVCGYGIVETPELWMRLSNEMKPFVSAP